MTLSDLLLLGARTLPIRALRQSAFRKYCRQNRGLEVLAECHAGFRMHTVIGDAVDNNIAVRGVFEEGTSHVIESLGAESASLLDVGCNIGYYACLFHAKNPSKPLVAVDPNPAMVARTQANLELNGAARFEILNCGIGSAPGTLELHVPRDRHSLSSFAYVPKKGGPSETISCAIRPMHDVIMEQGLGEILVKIDTEGFEYEVFRGLEEASTAKIRFMLFELAAANLEQAGSTTEQIFGLPALQGFDAYVIHDDEGGYVVPTSASALCQDADVNANVLLVQRGREAQAALKRSKLRVR